MRSGNWIQSRWSFIASGFLLLTMMLGASGCTRSIKGENLRLVIPFAKTSNSTLGAGDYLKHAIVNVQIPGAATPKVYEFDYEESPVAWGTPVEITVSNVPSGPGIVVQFLGIFETASGASMLITYGDADVTVNPGTTTVDITATPAGTVTKEGRVAGRYFNSSTGGPSGTVVAYFNPPNGKPKMAVDKFDMLGGYFNAFVLDNIPLTYIHLDSGITIFSAATLTSPDFNASASMLRVGIPARYEREEKNGTSEIKPRVASDLILGFFKNANGPSFSSYKACYAQANESIPGWYKNYAAPILSGPIVANLASGGSSDMRVLGASGTSETLDEWGTSSNGSCDPQSSTALVLQHHLAGNNEESFAGFSAPFRMIDPFSGWGGTYVKQEYVTITPGISLTWDYMAGMGPTITGSGFNGVDILYKVSSGGGGGGGGRDYSCNNLIEEGYQVSTSINSSAETYTFTHTNLNSSTYWQYQFAVCPFIETAGVKKYVGNFARGDTCYGNCGELGHFGWGTQSITMSVSTWGAAYSKVIGVDSTSSQLYDVISLSGGVAFNTTQTGGEALFVVHASASDSKCGTFMGQSIRPGTKNFSRILSATSSTLQIPKGSFLGKLDSMKLGNATAGNDFCMVSATEVKHYSDLTVTSSPWAPAFSFADGGGIVAFRVAGMLSLSSMITISAETAGFKHGTAPGDPGTGIRGEGSADFTANNGKVTNASGGGGAGVVGNGGRGLDSITLANGGQGGQAPNSGSLNSPTYHFGGGGALLASTNQSEGGGIVFVTSRYMSVAGTGGLAASGNVATASNGGGGGGSVIIHLDRLVSGTLDLRSTGGNQYGTGAYAGGAGGGGAVAHLICTNTGTLTTNVLAGTGSATGANAAQNGQVLNLLSNWGNSYCSQ